MQNCLRLYNKKKAEKEFKLNTSKKTNNLLNNVWEYVKGI